MPGKACHPVYTFRFRLSCQFDTNCSGLSVENSAYPGPAVKLFHCRILERVPHLTKRYGRTRDYAAPTLQASCQGFYAASHQMH
jgi:hypothetical protein